MERTRRHLAVGCSKLWKFRCAVEGCFCLRVLHLVYAFDRRPTAEKWGNRQSSRSRTTIGRDTDNANKVWHMSSRPLITGVELAGQDKDDHNLVITTCWHRSPHHLTTTRVDNKTL